MRTPESENEGISSEKVKYDPITLLATVFILNESRGVENYTQSELREEFEIVKTLHEASAKRLELLQSRIEVIQDELLMAFEKKFATNNSFVLLHSTKAWSGDADVESSEIPAGEYVILGLHIPEVSSDECCCLLLLLSMDFNRHYSLPISVDELLRTEVDALSKV